MDTQIPTPTSKQTNPPAPPDNTHPTTPKRMGNTVIFWMIGITVLLAVEAGFLYYKNVQLEKRINDMQNPPIVTQPTPNMFPSSIPEPTVTSIICGGIKGTRCPNGYTCQTTAMYPDATGTCVADTNTNTKLTCPANGWVDCMPILTEEAKKRCTPEAMKWYKTNCPNFQGGAL